jgi:hypothetical protein
LTKAEKEVKLGKWKKKGQKNLKNRLRTQTVSLREIGAWSEKITNRSSGRYAKAETRGSE